MTHSIISLGQSAALSALLLRANCQLDTLPITPLYGAYSVNRCVRAYRERASAAYARTQQNAHILLYRGSYSPTAGSKVGLHKGFDAHKAPDTPPGRVGDVVGGFQIIPALVGNQGITEPSCLDRIQAVLLAPHLVDLIQLFRAGTGIRLQADVALGFEEIEHVVVVPLHQLPVALGTFTLGELKTVLHQLL